MAKPHLRHLATPPRRGRVLSLCVRSMCRVAQTLVAVCFALVALAMVLAVVAQMRPVPVGGWIGAMVGTELQARLAAQGLQGEVDEFNFSLRNGLVPVVQAQDVRLTRLGDAEPLVSLRSAEIVFHRDGIVAGLLQPKAMRLSGLRVYAVSDGQGVSLGAGQAQLLRAVTAPGEALAQLDALLDRPSLRRLEELGVQGIELSFEDQVNGWGWHSREGRFRLGRHGTALHVDLALSAPGLAPQPGGRMGPGAVRITAVADTEAVTGNVRIALRGVNPAQLLPRESRHFRQDGASGVDLPVSLDLRAQLAPDGHFGMMDGAIAVGDGRLPFPGGRVAQVEGGGARVQLHPGGQGLRLDHMSFTSDLLSFEGSAQVLPKEGTDGRLHELVAQLSLAELTLAEGLPLEAPLALAHLETALRLDMATGRLDMAPSHMVSGDTVLEMSGFLVPPPRSDGGPERLDRIALRPDAQERSRKMLPDGWQMGIDIATDGLSAREARDLWPPMVEPRARDWISDSVKSGRLDGVRLSMRLAPVGKPDAAMSFRFSEVDLRAHEDVPLFEHGQGFFSLQDRRLAVMIDAAQMAAPDGGFMSLRKGFVTKSDVRNKTAPLEVSGQGYLETADALRLLGLPLFNGGVAAGPPLPPQSVSGHVALDLALSLPMGPDRKTRKLSYEATGWVQHAVSDTLIPGREVATQALAIRADREQVELSGAVTLDGFPADVVWSRALGDGTSGSQLSFTAPVTQPLLASFGVPLKPWEMSGAGRAFGTVELRPEAPPLLDLEADLSGARFSLPGLGWNKSAGRDASLRLGGQLGEGTRFDTLALDAPGLRANGSLRLRPEGGLGELRLSRAAIGDWFDGALSIRPETARRVKLRLDGGTLRLNKAPEGDGGASPIGEVTVKLDRLDLGDGLALTAAQGTLDFASGIKGALSGRVNGGAPVDVTLTPSDGGSRVRVKSANAGAVLRDAKFYPRARGGTLDLRLTPAGGKGRYVGKLKIEDTVIADAPFVANLLSAVSLVGLAEQAGSGGLQFGDIRAEFLLTPDRIVVSESSATGPSLGLSLDGSLDLKRKTMDMQGVISPFYFVNRVGAGMTRRGEGVLGISFKLDGGFDEPRVRANPLSILAPGMFRELFRRPPPQLKGAEAVQ